MRPTLIRLYSRAAAMLLMMLLTTATAWAETIDGVSYIDEFGELQTANIVTVLTGSETPGSNGCVELSAGWYVVNSDIDYNCGIKCYGDVNIILADGCTMNIGEENNPISNGCCIASDAAYGNPFYSLTIYGQSVQSGTLNAYKSGDLYDAVLAKDYTQYGGNVSIKFESASLNSSAINTDYGNITVSGGNLTVDVSSNNALTGNTTLNGGTLTAKATDNFVINGNTTVNGGTLTAEANGAFAIYGAFAMSGGTFNATTNYGTSIFGNFTMTGGTVTADDIAVMGDNWNGDLTFSGGTVTADDIGVFGNITLSWTSASDRLTASSYSSTVTIADGKSFYNGSEVVSGVITDLDKLDGKTLMPYVTIAAKQATVGGQTDYWTTLYRGDAGFAIVAEENACAYTATVSGETITLHRLGKVIPQGTAVIIVGEDAEIGMTTSTADAEYTVENNLHGVDVATALTDVKSTYSADAILVLSNKNSHFGFHELATTNVPARKAFLPINDPSGAREFTMVFEETTGIMCPAENAEKAESADAWYTLDGRRLNGKPTAKGLYVNSGRKVVIK